jgi:hypothetical protein
MARYDVLLENLLSEVIYQAHVVVDQGGAYFKIVLA